MEILEIKPLFDNWELLIEELTSDQSEDTFIYRGHTNEYNFKTSEFFEWQLISSFNRFYPRNTYSFRTIIHQQLEPSLFKSAYENYNYPEIKSLINSNQLEKLYFIQHYGIPTCFIDFTYNPIKALYFAISNLKGTNGGSYDMQGNPKFYPDNCYVSIFKIDYQLLQKSFGLKNIDVEDFPYQYDQYFIEPFYLGLDLTPLKNCQADNYNLQKQEGCFLLYDNDSTDMCLHKCLKLLSRGKEEIIDNPIITRYDLKYNSISRPLHSIQPDRKSLFNYLSAEKATGKWLFNDIQGLKYDFNFFHA